MSLSKLTKLNLEGIFFSPKNNFKIYSGYLSVFKTLSLFCFN